MGSQNTNYKTVSAGGRHTWTRVSARISDFTEYTPAEEGKGFRFLNDKNYTNYEHITRTNAVMDPTLCTKRQFVFTLRQSDDRFSSPLVTITSSKYHQSASC